MGVQTHLLKPGWKLVYANLSHQIFIRADKRKGMLLAWVNHQPVSTKHADLSGPFKKYSSHLSPDTEGAIINAYEMQLKIFPRACLTWVTVSQIFSMAQICFEIAFLLMFLASAWASTIWSIHCKSSDFNLSYCCKISWYGGIDCWIFWRVCNNPLHLVKH